MSDLNLKPASILRLLRLLPILISMLVSLPTLSAQTGVPAPAFLDSLVRIIPPPGVNDTLRFDRMIIAGNQLYYGNRQAEGLTMLLAAFEWAKAQSDTIRVLQAVQGLRVDAKNVKRYLEMARPFIYSYDMDEAKLGRYFNMLIFARDAGGLPEQRRFLIHLEKIGKRKGFGPMWFTFLYGYYSMHYLEMKDNEKALEAIRFALRYAEQTKDLSEIVDAKQQLTDILFELRDTVQVYQTIGSYLRDTTLMADSTTEQRLDKSNAIIPAIKHLMRAKKFADAEILLEKYEGRFRSPAGALYYKALLLYEMQRYAEAKKIITTLIREKKIGYNFNMGILFLGRICYKMKDYEEAISYLKQAEEIHKLFFNRAFYNEYLEILDLLIKSNYALKRHDEVYRYDRMLVACKDTIIQHNEINQTNRLKVAEIENEFAGREQELKKESAAKSRNISALGALSLVFMSLGGFIFYQLRRIRSAKRQNDALLLNILPKAIVNRIRRGERSIADYMQEVTVVFIDIVNFTGISAQIGTHELIKMLNDIFARLDTITEKHGLEKIKTIGDCYMVASGLPAPRPDHLERAVEMTLEVLQTLNGLEINGQKIYLKVGLESGPAIAGIIGVRKFIFDLWGDTVNTASRMESNGKAGAVHTTEHVFQKIGHQYNFERRGDIDIKGKGMMTTYWLYPN